MDARSHRHGVNRYGGGKPRVRGGKFQGVDALLGKEGSGAQTAGGQVRGEQLLVGTGSEGQDSGHMTSPPDASLPLLVQL